MEKGRSKIRNEALAKAFFYMRLMEKWGSGIPRVVQEVCDEGLAVPIFEEAEREVSSIKEIDEGKLSSMVDLIVERIVNSNGNS